MGIGFILPPDSKPIIRETGWHPILCIAGGLISLSLVLFTILKWFG